ncbi:MAG: VanW family protein [Clostridia bacterium]|nr:VanW family protein [Clostridia bacterium]
MKQIIRFCGIFLTLVMLCTSALGEIYTGTVTKDMTIRKTRSTSGKKLGNVTAGETVSIQEFGETWTMITKDGITGYILTKNVTELTLPGAPADTDAALYIGEATKDLTVRSKRSRSAQALQEIHSGDPVYITELGKEWMAIVKNGVAGYVLSSGIDQITAAREGIVVPEEFRPEPPFLALYTATADINLTLRKSNNAKASQVGMVYEGESIEVMNLDGEWAHVRKKGTVGYVLAEHLRYYRRTDPYGPYIPGVEFYPYAAHITQDVDIYDDYTGEYIRTLHAGDVIATSGMDERFSVYLPYQRTRGRIKSTSSMTFEQVHAWDFAQPGELIAIFSTFYAETPSSTKEEGRLYNISEGVKRLNGVRIHSGEEFRFNDYCAPYTRSNGYVEGPIINYVSDKKTGYGGGICQVSTTLYDAALQIPIEIVKQSVHSAYGIFYAPLDMDAAVGAGNLDLRLKNVLPYDIELRMDTQDGVMCVRIYYCKD